VAPSRRPKGGWTRKRRYWDTAGIEVVWSRASKTVSHKGADLELDALTNRKPVKGVSDEGRHRQNIVIPSMRRTAALRIV